MKKSIFIFFVMLISFSGWLSAGEEVELAKRVTQDWLKMLDQQDYKNTWEHAATLFKQQVSEQQWRESAGKVQQLFGSVRGRRLIDATYLRSLPGAPDGHYVVIQYETQFANKAKATETVTPMLDADGVWRVSGYYIK